MKIEISPEAFNALVQEYDQYLDLYNEVTEDDPGDEVQQAFIALFETVGMVIAEVVEEGLDNWCEQNRSIMEEALREAQEVK